MNVDEKDDQGQTPLHYAVNQPQDWIGLHMFGKPFRPMQPFAVSRRGLPPWWGLYCLIFVPMNREQVAQFLVKKYSASMNVKDNNGKTPLQYAAYCGQRSACRALYEMGARGTAAARRDGEAGRRGPHVVHMTEQMAYLIFCGMACEMAGFAKTVAEQYDSVAGERNLLVFFLLPSL